MNTLVLFKNNLRIQDNPVLYNAAKNNHIIPVYIHDEHYTSKKLGSASKYWLHSALQSLNSSLNDKLLFFKGETQNVIDKLIDEFDVKDIYCEEAFLEDDIKLLEKLKLFLASRNISYIF